MSVDRVTDDDLELIDPASLEPHPDNPRVHADATIRRSIEDHGMIDAVVAQRSRRRILGGHGRWENAVAAGATRIPVLWVDCDDDEAEEILLVLNRSADEASYDNDALVRLLSRIKDSGRSTLRAGWGPEDLRRFVAKISPQPLVEAPIPELRADPITQPGDLWELGEHRLLCGDATDPQAYELVLEGEKADLCLTDPPYGNETEYATYEDTPENLQRLVDLVLPLVLKHSKVALLTPGVGNMFRYPAPKWVLCWPISAGAGSCSWGFASWQPVLAYGPDPYLAAGLGRRPDTHITPSLPASSSDHPCAKPIDVWAWFMERGTTKAGQTVLDCFAGSGTTIVAAEQTDRRARLIEIDPGYCDVIVTRWENLTSRKATRK